MTCLVKLLVISALFYTVLLSWSKPERLHEQEFFGMSPGMVRTKLGADILLSLTARENPGQLSKFGFIEYEKSDEMKPFKLIDNDRDCTYGTMTGDQTKITYLYSVSSGARTPKSSTAECDSGINKGCLEIMFRQSEDLGLTWTEPVFASRKNMTDLAHRRGASILHIPETGRVYIFYMKTEIFGQSYLAYITRPGGSTIFSTEYTISKLVNIYDYAVSNAVTMVNKKQIFHLAWIQDGKFTYLATENVIYWGEQIVLDTAKSISQNYEGIQLVPFKIEHDSDELICAFYVDGNKNGQIKCNKGKLGKNDGYITKIDENLHYIRTGICPDYNHAIIVARTGDETIKAYIYDNKLRKAIKIEEPFEGQFLIEFPQVTCEDNGAGGFMAKVVAYNRREQTEY